MSDNTIMTDAEIEAEGKRISMWWQSLSPEQQEANQQKVLDMIFGAERQTDAG